MAAESARLRRLGNFRAIVRSIAFRYRHQLDAPTAGRELAKAAGFVRDSLKPEEARLFEAAYLVESLCPYQGLEWTPAEPAKGHRHE